MPGPGCCSLRRSRAFAGALDAGQSGSALLGDKNKVVTSGHKRISHLAGISLIALAVI
jgi:hypothetical protein